ncbi:endonuclease III [Zavarzinella formosa]|uniref:endonuclease III n=1 Tax=Zavarzinella formosa TaxID=360055 RepID=UPI0002F04646|nr:endonuclease III [Zavarzinella formosa]
MPADLPKPAAAVKRRATRIRAELAKLYPDAFCALNHDGPLQLLVATILSAQCTDARVNLVTPALFAKYPHAKDYAEADPAELEGYIASTGFFRNKAKNIRECCRLIVERHGGEVPQTLDELVLLPGVGRKTANVVLGDCFDIPGITVDTHVGRLSRRLGLTENDDPVKVELDLMAVIPQPEWTTFSHRMIFHGRQVCHSRNPNCAACTMEGFCPKIGVNDKEGATS